MLLIHTCGPCEFHENSRTTKFLFSIKKWSTYSPTSLSHRTYDTTSFVGPIPTLNSAIHNNTNMGDELFITTEQSLLCTKHNKGVSITLHDSYLSHSKNGFSLASFLLVWWQVATIPTLHRNILVVEHSALHTSTCKYHFMMPWSYPCIWQDLDLQSLKPHTTLYSVLSVSWSLL